MPIGSIKNKVTSNQSPYDKAVAQCDEALAERKKSPIADAPASALELLVEETFSLLDYMLGCGLDEEAITAAFMSCWASAHRFWTRNWIWEPRQGVGDLTWLHFNKKSETRLGADFALAFALADGTFNILVVQAKRYANETSETERVEQLAYHKTEDSPYAGKTPEQIRMVAECGLDEAKSGKIADADTTTPHWQLTRLMLLKDILTRTYKVGSPAIEFLYVAWPDAASLPPLYRRLDEVLVDIGDVKDAKTRRRKQYFALKHEDCFRDLLVTASTATQGGLPLKQAGEILDEMGSLCTTVIVVDVTGKGLANELATNVKNATAVKQKSEPKRAHGTAPGQ